MFPIATSASKPADSLLCRSKCSNIWVSLYHSSLKIRANSKTGCEDTCTRATLTSTNWLSLRLTLSICLLWPWVFLQLCDALSCCEYVSPPKWSVCPVWVLKRVWMLMSKTPGAVRLRCVNRLTVACLHKHWRLVVLWVSFFPLPSAFQCLCVMKNTWSVDDSWIVCLMPCSSPFFRKGYCVKSLGGTLNVNILCSFYFSSHIFLFFLSLNSISHRVICQVTGFPLQILRLQNAVSALHWSENIFSSKEEHMWWSEWNMKTLTLYAGSRQTWLLSGEA